MQTATKKRKTGATGIKKALGLCPVKYCRKPKAKKCKFCAMHTRRAYKLKNPLGVKWEQLKDSAKRRAGRYADPARYAFTITRANFIDWATYHGFTAPGNLTGETLTVDRKNSNYGYHIWNIAPLKMRENSAKGKKTYVEYYRLNPHLLQGGENPEDYAFLDQDLPGPEEVPF